MSSEKLIANELLAFIQHTMDEVSIMQICKSNFKKEEICSSKVLLYQTLGQADPMPTRRRDGKGERSLQDTINLLKCTDPDDVPDFVAKQLHKLPHRCHQAAKRHDHPINQPVEMNTVEINSN